MPELHKSEIGTSSNGVRCDIIIPIWNQFNLTRDCVESIIKNTRYPYRLILVDNASDDDTKQYLERLKGRKSLEAELIRNEENLGFVKAVNQGLKVSKAPYVCIMNNDTIATADWLDRLIEFAESHGDVGLMNPLCGGPPDVPIEEYARLIAKDKDKYMEMNQCQGFCMLVKREVIDKIGYLDESFGVGGFDDTDFSMRAYKSGYRSVCVYSSCVYHRQHRTFNVLQMKRERIIRENEETYFNKWGRGLRLAYVVTPSDMRDDMRLKEMIQKVLGLAREWCWLHVWIFGDVRLIDKFKNKIEELKIPLHQNIKYHFNQVKFINSPFLKTFVMAFVILKLLERSFGTKRRKRYDTVLLGDEELKSFIDKFRYLHSAASFKDAGLAAKEIVEFVKKNVRGN